MFKFVKAEDDEFPSVNFQLPYKEREFSYSAISNKIILCKRSRTYWELVERYDYVSFDMICEFGKI